MPRITVISKMLTNLRLGMFQILKKLTIKLIIYSYNTLTDCTYFATGNLAIPDAMLGRPNSHARQTRTTVAARPCRPLEHRGARQGGTMLAGSVRVINDRWTASDHGRAADEGMAGRRLERLDQPVDRLGLGPDRVREPNGVGYDLIDESSQPTPLRGGREMRGPRRFVISQAIAEASFRWAG